MKVNISLLIISILFLTLINFITNQEKETFTAEAMHLLNRLSSFVASPDKKYIVICKSFMG